MAAWNPLHRVRSPAGARTWRCAPWELWLQRPTLVNLIGSSFTPRRLVPVAWGVDTLHLFTRFPIALQWAERLKEAKEAAKETERPILVEVGGLELTVRPYGTAAGAFLLESDLFVVKVAPKPRGEASPTVSVEIRALALWTRGWEVAANIATDAMAALCGRAVTAGEGSAERAATERELDVQVTRLDVNLDFQGWVPVPEDLNVSTCRVRKGRRGSHFGTEWLDDDGRAAERARVLELAARLKASKSPTEQAEILAELHRVEEPDAPASTYGDRRQFTGFSFGRGKVSARLYDKTKEITISRKGWFRKVWSKATGYDESAPVWRLEFQLRREALVDFHELLDSGDTGSTVRRSSMGAWSTVKESLPVLWSHLTRRWLRHGHRTAASRQVPSSPWRRLQRWPVRQLYAMPELVRVHLTESVTVALPQLAGYLASAAAQLVELEPDGTRVSNAARPFSELVISALAAAHAYAEAKERPIEEKFRERRKLLSARRRMLAGPRRAQAAHLAHQHLDTGTERGELVNDLLRGFGRTAEDLGAAQRYVERLGVLVRHDLQDDAGEEQHGRHLAELDNRIAALRRDLWHAVEVDDTEAAEALRSQLAELEHQAHDAAA